MAARRAVVDNSPAGWFGPQDDVLQHRELVGQHEVLVDHPDASVDGFRGGGELHLGAVDQHLTLIGRLHPVEDLHESRLAGPVLAHYGVDLALSDTEVDMVVGHNAGEALSDADQLHG